GIDKYFNLQYELEIGEVPDNFTYYAMGHLHNYINDDFGKGKLVYPGSSEIWKTTEIEDYRKNGKGFVIVDLDSSKPSVERIIIDLPREFIDKTIDFENLADEIESIKNTIKDFDKKPIINLTINNVTSTSAAYELINEELDDLTLMVRPKFNTPGEENIDLIIDKENALGPVDVLASRLESYDDEDITKFVTDLYGLLSKDKNEEARELIDEFYKRKFPIDEEEED
ncbi:MAG: DNA repair exonuclease, partial [Methanobrevibacter sp.]|nr:DNA repair exonuclease [Methanobrevibacter sp.]